MKKLLWLLLLVPLLGTGQTKSVIHVQRVFPKAGKVLDFEKALIAHVQRFHKGNWSWRVSEVQTGPDAGGYSIVEGPNTWETFDGRGDLGAEHRNDWERNVSIYLTERFTESYSVYQDSLSTSALTDYTEKQIVNHMFPKPGMISQTVDLVKKLKNTWKNSNESVAVYMAVNSGAPQIITVTRLKAGLKELEGSYRKPLPERYDATNGAGSFDIFTQDYAKAVENRWSEITFFRPDLSSK